MKGRIGAELGTHNADLTSGSTVRVADAVDVLFVRRVAMLTAREMDLNIFTSTPDVLIPLLDSSLRRRPA